MSNEETRLDHEISEPQIKGLILILNYQVGERV